MHQFFSSEAEPKPLIISSYLHTSNAIQLKVTPTLKAQIPNTDLW